MNRIFHARIGFVHWLVLLLFALLTIYGFLNRSSIPSAVGMIALVLLVERLIHTTYTVTSQGTLVIYRGRFARGCTIPLSRITLVERHSACFSLVSYVVVRYGDGKQERLMPVKEEELVRKLRIKN